MRNVRYLIDEQFQAEEIAKDLEVQLEVNRFFNISVTAVENRNEVIVQIPESNDNLEEAIGSFMDNYKTGVILE